MTMMLLRGWVLELAELLLHVAQTIHGLLVGVDKLGEHLRQLCVPDDVRRRRASESCRCGFRWDSASGVFRLAPRRRSSSTLGSCSLLAIRVAG